MNRKDYEEDLRRRQKEHLDKVQEYRDNIWDSQNVQSCAHDQCIECIGTGIKTNGQTCIHYLHCTCPKCAPYYGITTGINSFNNYGNTGYQTSTIFNGVTYCDD